MQIEVNIYSWHMHHIVYGLQMKLMKLLDMEQKKLWHTGNETMTDLSEYITFVFILKFSYLIWSKLVKIF